MFAKKLLIIGNYGAGNLGDDAILGGILIHLRALGFGGTVSVTHGGVSTSTDIYRGLKKVPFYPAGFRSRLNRPFRKEAEQAFRASDMAILGGGGLFTDAESWKAPYIWYRQAKACVRFKVPYVCYAQSVGPLHSWLARRWARFVFKKAESVHVRDAASAQELKALGIESVSVGTDSALAYLRQYRSASIQKEKVLLFIPRLWPGISAKEWETVLPILREHAHEKGWKLIGLSMEATHFQERQLFRDLGIEFFEPSSALQAFEAIQKAQAVVSMRLHGSIFSMAAGVPFVALSYTSKVQNFFEGAPSGGMVVLDMKKAGKSLRAALKGLKPDSVLDLTPLLDVNQQFFSHSVLNS